MKQLSKTPSRPFGPIRSGAPVVPDRSLELIYLGAGGILAALSLVLIGYIWLQLQMPEAALWLLPVPLISALFIIPAMTARRERLNIEIAHARYQEGLRKAFSEL
ncbi:hypothetical protein [Sphingobium sp. TCM1]|uniref:hypothetical protein n=1 Tax=Sphingobium sp. TCM1 TaxID=453246 RepID=UPI0012EE4B1D|nr:hypothetical protein [Sphingobium sp. TCM1]